MSFSKLNLLFAAFICFFSLNGNSAAAEDLYTLKLKGFVVPAMYTIEQPLPAGIMNGSFCLASFLRGFSFQGMDSIRGGEYHVSIPRSWVTQNLKKEENGYELIANLSVTQYQTGKFETEPKYEYGISLLFPEDTRQVKYKVLTATAQSQPGWGSGNDYDRYDIRLPNNGKWAE